MKQHLQKCWQGLKSNFKKDLAMKVYRREDLIVKDYVRKSRDLDFEERYNFNPDLDYKAELDTYNKLVQNQDKEGLKMLVCSHGGRIAFFGKVFYHKECKEAGLL